MACAEHGQHKDGCAFCEKKRAEWMREPPSWDEVHFPPGPSFHPTLKHHDGSPDSCCAFEFARWYGAAINGHAPGCIKDGARDD